MLRRRKNMQKVVPKTGVHIKLYDKMEKFTSKMKEPINKYRENFKEGQRLEDKHAKYRIQGEELIRIQSIKSMIL